MRSDLRKYLDWANVRYARNCIGINIGPERECPDPTGELATLVDSWEVPEPECCELATHQALWQGMRDSVRRVFA